MDRLFWNGGNRLENRVPSSALTLMPAVYLKIFPAVNRELDFWTKRAKQIPDDELRTQALESIKMKRFHCQGDRKSTRLNSSHVAISYAVFCLKKKKKH